VCRIANSTQVEQKKVQPYCEWHTPSHAPHPVGSSEFSDTPKSIKSKMCCARQVAQGTLVADLP
jgi:hypothetical protein